MHIEILSAKSVKWDNYPIHTEAIPSVAVLSWILLQPLVLTKSVES